MSTTTLFRLECGCEFLEQLDTWGLLSLRIDPCNHAHRTELEAFKALLAQRADLEAENARLRDFVVWLSPCGEASNPPTYELIGEKARALLKEQDDDLS